MIAKEKFFKEDDFAVVGRVRRVWGVRGQLSVDWNNGSCPVEVGSDCIYLRAADDGSLDRLTIVVDHRHGDCNIITLEGLSSPDEVKKYRGSDIWVEKVKLPPLGKDEYYTYQLIEMRVETVDGEYLGKIAEIFPTGGNDVYAVRNGSEELLIPAIDDVVKKVDVEAGVMVVELMEGLR